MNQNILLVVCLVVSVVRFVIPTHHLTLTGSYEAFAHLLVGFLAGAWWFNRQWQYLALLIGLTAVELIAFFSR